MKVSWDDEMPNLWKTNPNVPNHQPNIYIYIIIIMSIRLDDFPMSISLLLLCLLTVLLYIYSSFKRSERWYADVEWLDKVEITNDPRFHQDMLKRCTGNDMIINHPS